MSLTDFPPCTVAHRLEYAAQIIKANGLYQDGGYWQGWGGKTLGRQWKPGMPCCVVALLAAAKWEREHGDRCE